jgi:murein DD-endopeptidase MepM/ murein hydrolase activator NlpD
MVTIQKNTLFFCLLVMILTFFSSCSHQAKSGSYVLNEKGQWVFQESNVGLIYHNQQTHRGMKKSLFDDDPTYDSGKFIWPVPSSMRITSHFGKRGRKHHDGVDIGATKGASIVASADGKVLYAGKMAGYGNIVVVSHSGGYHTVYAHNHKNLVKKNQKVSQGEVIAQVGSTGRSSGNHLHFEIRKKNRHLDPIAYLGNKKSIAKK